MKKLLLMLALMLVTTVGFSQTVEQPVIRLHVDEITVLTSMEGNNSVRKRYLTESYFEYVKGEYFHLHVIPYELHVNAKILDSKGFVNLDEDQVYSYELAKNMSGVNSVIKLEVVQCSHGEGSVTIYLETETASYSFNVYSMTNRSE